MMSTPLASNNDEVPHFMSIQNTFKFSQESFPLVGLSLPDLSHYPEPILSPEAGTPSRSREIKTASNVSTAYEGNKLNKNDARSREYDIEANAFTLTSELPWFSPKKSSDTPTASPTEGRELAREHGGDVGSRELNSSLPAVDGDQNGDRRVNNNSTINAEVSKMHQESKGRAQQLFIQSAIRLANGAARVEPLLGAMAVLRATTRSGGLRRRRRGGGDEGMRLLHVELETAQRRALGVEVML
ncbi:hypothetical protein EYF80_036301 [Liparis tanakae]|uniref:Uncharacterized protein n=1 Tax=Liparis tanakae TaxID=230148 RepID=A0A4Z2GJK1_9TELE|nr:hypothetical protein EYF80_036301 [Liparis tanakae]